jgi:hypothetical protein
LGGTMSLKPGNQLAMFAFILGALALALTLVAEVMARTGLKDLLWRSAPAVGLLLLLSAMRFAVPRSRTYFVLIGLSFATSFLVLGLLGWRLLAH